MNPERAQRARRYGRALPLFLAVAAVAALGASAQAVEAVAPVAASAPAHVAQVIESAALAATPIRVMTVGDSITLDQDGASPGSYRVKLEQLLVANGFQPTWIVAAVAGSRCSHWSPLIKGLLNQHNPDLVILSCGTNDDTTTAAARDAMGWHFRTIVETIRTHRSGPDPVKIVAGQIGLSDPYYPGMGGTGGLPAAEERANGVLRQNIAYYVPGWQPAFQVVDFSRVPGNPTTTVDGVHPSPKGHGLYARLIYDAGAAGGWWPATDELAACELYGHPRGTPVPEFMLC